LTESVVVAIGGNALSPTDEPSTVVNQFRHTRESLGSVVDFALEGWNVAVVPGNGPQVGDELLRSEVARDEVEPLPLGVLVASTAGWIGYMVQQSIQNALRKAGSSRGVVSVITQVVVDPADELEPTKAIGREVARERADELRRLGIDVAPDARGRLRRRVASPAPIEIVEAPVLRQLVAGGDVVVACGGGGVPVYRDPDLGLEGLDVVVDKDRAAGLLAREIGAGTLLILTDVDGVYRDYGTPDARILRRLRSAEARQLVASGQLGEGSMRPKVEAALEFVEAGGERAVIAHLGRGGEALSGEVGTEIVS
jgi:carbamate kinase